MVDFKRLPPRTATRLLYRCTKCGETDIYNVRMPPGWKHEVTELLRPCDGELELIGDATGKGTGGT